ncbi:copper resistance CopC family protein [Mycobacterium sp. 236(2023)]|uniref:copper resistance CopC family protein n=1 Tax=Mycobacterium sp. 236(2023) TaxID=3038163 RepID=UPI00241559D9|nr:copper resistance CopC family protein [Mycobacterium sp. 236(2023)]MDG4668369.1 copper resistance protein CopC [Mycobacterium sp. 236(2023)]
MTSIQRAWHAFFAAALAAGLFAGALGAAGAAWAHAALVSSDPTANASLPLQPPSVSATFNETMQAQFAAMTVVGPDGTQWADGEPTVDGAVISVGVKPGGPAGTYTVNYRATSADGHVVTGAWSYEVLQSATTTQAPATSPAAPTTTATTTAAPAGDTSSGGLPAWPFVLGTTAIVAAGAIWAVRRRS